MHRAWGSHSRTFTLRSRATIRRPKKSANTTVAKPKRTARHHNGVMES